MSSRVLADEDAMLEFPKGSGMFAEYRASEREIMRKLTRPEQILIHGLKAEFGGILYDF